MPSTILTIAGTDYGNTARAAARVRPDALDLQFDGGDDAFAFSEIGGHFLPTWGYGDAVEVTWFPDDVTPRLVFAGTIADVSHTPTESGWVIGYQALSRRHAADHVPVTGYDRTGEMAFNRSPEDPLYTSSEAGLTLGEILALVLTVEVTATALDALGVGGYTGLTPPTLPAATVADLALLDVVPSQQVGLRGEGLLAQVEQLLQQWMPRWTMRVTPDGTIRFLDTRDIGVSGTFVPATVVLPNATTGGDPVTWPAVRRSTARCATRVVVRGSADVEAALLSTADGTLAPAWDSGDEVAWTYSDFTHPKDAYSEGAVTSMTGNSAVLDPDDAARAWGSNFWAGREATLYLFAPLATGLDMTLSRPVTANAALTAGGTASATWDAAWPADSTGYTRYKLVGGAGGNAEVGRLYTVREPATGDTGLDTHIGSHLVPRSPLPLKVANSSGFISVHYPQGFVCREDPADPPGMEVPLNVETIPTRGQFRFYQPVVSVYGDPIDLEAGYPTTIAGGLPGEVRVVALYSRGTLEAVVPANSGVGLDVPEYAGTAHAVDGVARTKVIDVPNWTNRGDHPRMLELAQQYLDVLQDAVYEGAFEWYGLPPWDWWEPGTAVNFSCPPHTGLWEDMDAPIRSVRLSWPQGEGMLHKLTIQFGNAKRPHAGDDLYLPAAFNYQGLDTSRAFDQSESRFGINLDMGIDSGMGRLGASLAGNGLFAPGMLAGAADILGGAKVEGGGRGGGDPFEAARMREAGHRNPRHDAIQANQGRASRGEDRQLPMPLKPHVPDAEPIRPFVSDAQPLRPRAPGEPIAPAAPRGSHTRENTNPRRDAIRANREAAAGRIDERVDLERSIAGWGEALQDDPLDERITRSRHEAMGQDAADLADLDRSSGAGQPRPLRPHEPTESERDQAERGRAERERLDREDD